MKASIHNIDATKDAYVYEAQVSDIKAVADFAKDRANCGLIGDPDFKHAASVPAFIIHKYCDDRGMQWREFMNDQKLINQFLDSEYCKPFRIWQGRI